MKQTAKTFIDVCLGARLFEYGPTKGTIFFAPNGFAIWEKMQTHLNNEFAKLGVQNVYFPSLIPFHLLKKELNHITGFTPEFFMIEAHAGKKLTESLVLRPTSEVMFCYYFQKVVKSYRDLPLLLNQWVNVWRYEKNPNPFLRNMEFLWNEGHTLHATKKQATEFCIQILQIYQNFLEKHLLIPIFSGYKSEMEKFPGAIKTFALETILPDGQFLQLATVHEFETNFTKVFDIIYLDQNNQKQHPTETSWGLSTRAIAGLVHTHSDAKGLILPFQFANYQAIILPIYDQKHELINIKIKEYCHEITQKLSSLGIKFYQFDSERKSFGYGCYEAEALGIPLRIEIGKTETHQGTITFILRNDKDKKTLSFADFVAHFDDIIRKFEQQLYLQASQKQLAKIQKIDDFTVFQTAIKNKAFKVWFCNVKTCEEEIKKQTSTSSRILWEKPTKGCCFFCGQTTNLQAFFGRSY